MKITRLFQKTTFAITALFALIGISTSVLSINAVDSHLTQEYESNSKGIAKTIADASVDIILNRDLSSLQSLIDQFLVIQGISYIYINNEDGEFLAHTFVPGIPEEILHSDVSSVVTVHRNLKGVGDFVEVGSPILAGVAGTVHIGMDQKLVSLKVQSAIGSQIWLIFGIFIVGFFAALWFLNLVSKPINSLRDYAVDLAKKDEADEESNEQLLDRKDELGDLARLFQYFSIVADPSRKGTDPTTSR